MTIQADRVFLAKRLETFVDLVQDPKSYFERHPDAILPESIDLRISSAALYLLVDCYLRGRGLIIHHASKTEEQAMEALTKIWETVQEEVEARPHFYPKLAGVLARGQAAVELEWILDGYSSWSEED